MMDLADPLDAPHFEIRPYVVVRPARTDELAYCRGSFAEGFKLSANALGKMPWTAYKRDVRPRLTACLAAAELLVADLDGDIAGWIALTRGRRVDTVHWIATRLRIGVDGPSLRRHGIARRLVDAAQLKDRIVYTHRGPKRSDVWISQWLGRRGAISVVYEPYESWKV